MFTPRAVGIDCRERHLLFSLHIDFGTRTSPLCAALPDQVIEHVAPEGDLASIVSLLTSEQQANRCGSPAVLGRLGEVLVVRVLRLQLDRGVTTPGLLAGLANPRISQAIVAMHENPGHHWRNADLAETAGLSHSRFKEVFSELVGETPASYLRRWRLTLARVDLEKGERVDRVAHRYGYRAPDAFSRAFLREFGQRPKATLSRASANTFV
ncbi:AraC family transcriptional regulator [uncultured Tateyamaria sp.]|uniref:AraC family transcriptional regulator n=1 Tax=uncultured Tateyamaria sp. TaxID=455651 RepID=UPI00262674E6|nr:AraC family transcriptional regulator [uncultured Tateyamaria sp.]